MQAIIADAGIDRALVAPALPRLSSNALAHNKYVFRNNCEA